MTVMKMMEKKIFIITYEYVEKTLVELIKQKAHIAACQRFKCFLILSHLWSETCVVCARVSISHLQLISEIINIILFIQKDANIR